MSENYAEELRLKVTGMEAEGILEETISFFVDGNIALASSMSLEDQVITHMLSKMPLKVGVFTIDTGRLPQETYDLIDQTRNKYGSDIEVLFPEAADIRELIRVHGVNLFYKSHELRKECCRIRKVLPLQRKLAGIKAWITGIRKGQSVTRRNIEPVEWDHNFNLIKINPLFDWTKDSVRQYIKKNEVPYNALYDRGYTSIGCAPCTRAIGPGDDVRSGRWWWESPEHKECGLHRK